MLPLFAAAIISTTMSNSSTGGNVVNGNSVVTGDSYSSVSVQTYAGNDGSSSTVNIETDNNGQVNKQTITKAIPPGGSAEINVATSTGYSRVAIHVGASEGQGTTTASTAVFAASGFPLYFHAFLRHLFGVFRFR